MTYNSSTMLYASYTILLGGLQTCCVGSEKDHRVCLVSVCPSVLGVDLSPLRSLCSAMGQLSARYFPAANLFLMSEKRYPGPASSMSQPDRVLPSLVNCTASGAGLLGPSVS